MDVQRWVLYYSTVCDGLNMMVATPEIMREHPDKRYWVLTQDFDRVTAERDALQLRLNAVEEENDRLRSALHDLLHGTFPSGWEDDGSGSIGFSRECIERCNNAKAALEKRP